MNKLFWVLVAVVGLSGCEQAFDNMQGRDVYDHIREPPMEFPSLNFAGSWIVHNVTYCTPDPYEWKSPYQTMETKSGACTDFAGLLLWYAVERFGADEDNSYILGIREYNGTQHALCVINGIMYEPQTYTIRKLGYASEVGRWDLKKYLEIVYYQYGNRSTDNNLIKLD